MSLRPEGGRWNRSQRKLFTRIYRCSNDSTRGTGDEYRLNPPVFESGRENPTEYLVTDEGLTRHTTRERATTTTEHVLLLGSEGRTDTVPTDDDRVRTRSEVNHNSQGWPGSRGDQGTTKLKYRGVSSEREKVHSGRGEPMSTTKSREWRVHIRFFAVIYLVIQS